MTDVVSVSTLDLPASIVFCVLCGIRTYYDKLLDEEKVQGRAKTMRNGENIEEGRLVKY
jgi:hypothetical protein